MSMVAPGSGGELLERGESLLLLAGLLDGVRSGSEGRLVLVGGEAGVGKTALLRRFCELHGDAVRVLWGACEPLRTPRPLGPLVDVAEAIGGELEGLVAEAGRPHDVAMALLHELRGRPPKVLVLEDVHWADEATLDVLAVLAGRVGSAPVLVLASYRDDELDRSEQLRFVLGELVRRPGRVKVEALSPTGVVALAEPWGVDGLELHARTGGNPFFVTEVLAAGGSERIPDTVRDAVLARTARLSAPARRLLDAVAIIPGEAELWLLEALAEELVDRLEECLASGVLVAGRAHVGFRHELARLAVEEAISPERRMALHRAAGDALAAHGGTPDFAALAHHAEEARDADGVLRWAPPAAQRAALSRAHREAAAQYARALRFTDGHQLQIRAEFLERRARECYLTSQIDEAIGAQQEALQCHRRRGDQRSEANALRVLSRLLFFAGRASEAEPLVLQAIELLERMGADHSLAMAYANASQRRMVVSDDAGAFEWGNRALELARTLGDTEAEVYALSNVAAADFRTNSAEGRLQLEATLALAQRHGYEEHAALTFSRLVMFSVRYRRYDIALAHLEPGLEYCIERDLDTFRLYLLGCRARMELDLGSWDAAADSARLVLRDPRSAQLARSWALATLGLLRSRRGDVDGAAALEEAHAMAVPTFELDRIAQVAAARAEEAWLRRDHAAVEQVTDAPLRLALDRREPWAVGELACWRRRGGRRDQLPPGLAATPYASSIAGEWQRAADLWGELGCPYEAALALADSDDPAAARTALDQLGELGARRAAAIVAHRLRQRGVRGVPRGPRASTRENPAGLTARELEVLGLLSEGLRNAEIATRLVVSGRTVDHHVSAILRKLDAETRGEAAAKAARLGLAPPT